MQRLLILSISKTLLLARLRQSVIAAVGVTFGITMFITLLSFMTGLNDLLDGLIYAIVSALTFMWLWP